MKEGIRCQAFLTLAALTSLTTLTSILPFYVVVSLQAYCSSFFLSYS